MLLRTPVSQTDSGHWAGGKDGRPKAWDPSGLARLQQLPGQVSGFSHGLEGAEADGPVTIPIPRGSKDEELTALEGADGGALQQQQQQQQRRGHACRAGSPRGVNMGASQVWLAQV